MSNAEANAADPTRPRNLKSLDAALDAMVSNGSIPYVVAALGNSAGPIWSGAAGERASGMAAGGDTIFRIVSMSKAVGATAALILADRGRLDWETPVEEILPDFARLVVIENGVETQLRRPARTKATLRNLATHTSGLAYEFWDGAVGRYLAESGMPSIVSGQRAGLLYPLAFDPGTGWQYGGGADWLGLAVSAIDGRSIDRFCIEEIFEPLGLTSTSFELNATSAALLGDVLARTENGELRSSVLNLDPPASPEFYGMGHALYSTAPDYLRFLRMWLGMGSLDGVRILSEATARDALRNQIGTLRIEPRSTVFAPATSDLDPMPGVELSHSLVAARTERQVPGRRAVGSAFWGGVLNTHFWLDPTADLAGVFMTQVVPFLDGYVMRDLEEFERLSYSLMI